MEARQTPATSPAPAPAHAGANTDHKGDSEGQVPAANDAHCDGAADTRANPATDLGADDETAGRDLASQPALKAPPHECFSRCGSVRWIECSTRVSRRSCSP